MMKFLYPFICGGFCILVIINSTAMNIGMHVSFQISFVFFFFFFSLVSSGMALLGQMVFLFLVFWDTSILFSTVDEQIYIATESVQGFPFLYILDNICHLCSFVDNHSDRYEMVSHCGFDLHCSDN